MTNESKQLIQFNQVEKTFRNGELVYHALRGVDLSINPGELVSITGPSGSGKSTIMHIMGVLDKPSKGEYLLGGKNVELLSSNERAKIRNQKIGFVFQQFFLLSRISALQNVMLPLRYYRNERGEALSSADQRDRALDLLNSVGMASHANHRPLELSGGQQQRVAIARALICEPDLILADEPTGALDSKTSDAVMTLLKKINLQKKTTIIIVTHDNDIANQCGRIIPIRDGLIKQPNTG